MAMASVFMVGIRGSYPCRLKGGFRRCLKNYPAGGWEGTVRSVISEMRKALYLPVFILSCLGVVLICCLSEGFTSHGMRTYTILELLLFLPKDAMLTDISLSRYEVWTRGIGTWTQLFLPFLLSVGYLYTISNERQSGFSRVLLVRENNLKYGVSKLVAAVLGGGVIMTVGYALFGMLVYIRFPSVREYSEGSIKLYMEMNPGFQEMACFFHRCVKIFLYGMCGNVFAYLVSVFFRDKYILVCLPLMLKYIWGQAAMKAGMDAMNKGNETAQKLCSALRIENILNTGQPAYQGLTLFLVFTLYLAGVVLTLCLTEKRGEEFGFE